MGEFWLARVPEPSRVEAIATRAEASGWDGVAFTDSQNLVGDPFVAVAVAARATTPLRFMTGVANAATPDPAQPARGRPRVLPLGANPPAGGTVRRGARPGACLPGRRRRRPRRLPEPAPLAH